MMKSEQLNELAAALVAAQAEFSAVPKGSVNPFFKSKYAALPEVVATAGPVLSKHGLAISQFIDEQDTMTTYLLHTSGQFIAHTMSLHLVKNDPQAQGSAVTYARRYAYMAVLGLVADEDDDGNAASAPSHQQQSSQSLGSKVAAAAGRAPSSGGKTASEAQTRMIWAITHKSLNWDDNRMFGTLAEWTGRNVEKLDELTMDEAKLVIEKLKLIQDQQ
jgi:hypothetical protein